MHRFVIHANVLLHICPAVGQVPEHLLPQPSSAPQDLPVHEEVQVFVAWHWEESEPPFIPEHFHFHLLFVASSWICIGPPILHKFVDSLVGAGDTGNDVVEVLHCPFSEVLQTLLISFVPAGHWQIPDWQVLPVVEVEQVVAWFSTVQARAGLIVIFSFSNFF